MFEVNITHTTDLTKELGITVLQEGIIICYNVIVLIVGLIGNSLVLVGSIRYDAIHMDNVSIVLLRQLAATDIIMTLMIYLPMLITLISKDWSLGDGLCFFMGFFQYVPVFAEFFITVLI